MITEKLKRFEEKLEKHSEYSYILLPLAAFLGYSTGRLGHIIGGYTNSPHHWILGLIIAFSGVFAYKKKYKIIGMYLAAIGTAYFISDLNDFLNFRVWGPDLNSHFTFWGID